MVNFKIKIDNFNLVVIDCKCNASISGNKEAPRSFSAARELVNFPSWNAPDRYLLSTICATASCLNSSVNRIPLAKIHLFLDPKLPSKASTNLGVIQGQTKHAVSLSITPGWKYAVHYSEVFGQGEDDRDLKTADEPDDIDRDDGGPMVWGFS